MSDARPTIAVINTLDQERFVALFGSLFEGSPWMAADAWHARPFADRAELHRALCRVVTEAPVERQVTLIRAHPDLVGKAARTGTLTPESTQEQAAAGLDRLCPAAIKEFTRLNHAYRDRFDFPFVICARENKKDAILAGFAARLDQTREQEIATALAEIAKIAWYRLTDVVREDGAGTADEQAQSSERAACARVTGDSQAGM